MNNFQKLTVFFCVGVVPVQLLPSLPSVSLLAFLILCSLVAFKYARWLSICIVGFVWAVSYATLIQQAQLPASLEGQEIFITGHVVDLPSNEARSIRFVFQVDEALYPNGARFPDKKDDLQNIKHFPSKIRLSWYDRGKEVHSGEKWQFLVTLKRPHGLANPHGFDYEKWLFQQKMGATGYIRKSVDNKRIAEPKIWGVGHWRESLRNYIDQSINSSQHLGVIKALVLGDRSGITTDQWDVFRHTGTSHLIAISGLHIGLVSALLFGFVRWFALRTPFICSRATQYAVVASLLAAGAYAALAGFSVPTQRALIMLSVVLGAVYWQRHYTPFHIISVALVAVLIIDPLAVMSVGFWLSFGAVAVILYSATGRLKAPSLIQQLVQVQWWIAVGLMPLVLYFFQQVSLVAPVANMLAVPFVSLLVVPLLLIALLFGLVSYSLSAKALMLVNWLIDFMWGYLQILGNAEFAYLPIPNVSIWACLLAMLGVVFLLLPKGLIPKPLVCVLFVPLIFPMKTRSLNAGEFKLVLLDVGQGLSAVVHTAQHTLVFDTGAKYSEKSDLASNVIMPYLQGEQVKQIDLLVISHGDNDHAGGANTLLSNMKVEAVRSSVPERFASFNAVTCDEDTRWRWDGVLFEFLSPSHFNLFEGNNASCVLKVSSGNGSILLPGDIEKSAERSLLQYKHAYLDADVLIAPHHGSMTSSTTKFISAVSPHYVLFPVGYRNRFGFPKPTVVDRYKTEGALVFDTASHGAITVSFLADETLAVESFRAVNYRFWSWLP